MIDFVIFEDDDLEQGLQENCMFKLDTNLTSDFGMYFVQPKSQSIEMLKIAYDSRIIDDMATNLWEDEELLLSSCKHN